MNTTSPKLGFVGLGVMGGPMSTNLTRKSNLQVTVYDPDAVKQEKLQALGAKGASSVAGIGRNADIVFLSAPSIKNYEKICAERTTLSP